MQKDEEDPEVILSDADRRRIEAEERFRHEARSKLQRKRYKWVWWLVLTSFGLLLAAWQFGTFVPETGTVPRSVMVPRDTGTEVRAYQRAAEDFIHKKAKSYYTPNVASYSPDRVALQSDGRFMVTLMYEGRDQDGKWVPVPALYLIRCESGLCFVDGGPK